jgi:hypothetical protein
LSTSVAVCPVCCAIALTSSERFIGLLVDGLPMTLAVI